MGSLLVRGYPSLMSNFKCRSCGRPLPNRSRRSCAYCGAVLAETQQLNGERAEFLRKLKADETKKHREYMERDINTGGDPGTAPLPGQ
jgi:hypothetical protein